MSYRAVDALEEAYEATKGLLLPFDVRRWLVIAVVAFFVSGTTGFNANTNLGALDAPDGVPLEPILELGPGFGPAEALLIAGIVLVVSLIIGYVAAILEFVFVRMVSRQEIRIRGFFGETRPKGTSLFLFRIALSVVVVATILFVAAAVFFTGVAGLVVAVLLSPVFLLGFLAIALIARLTVDFVVPVMLVDDTGIIEAWRRFSFELRENAVEYGVYVLVRFVLGVVAGVVVAIGFTAVAIVVSIPFLTAGALLLLVESAVGLGEVTFVLLAGIVVLAVLVIVVVATTLVQVPVQTYLRYYSLFVLAAVSPRYDLLEGVRTETVDSGSDAPPDDHR